MMNTRGQVIVMVPILFVVLLLGLGLSFDFGNVLLKKNRAQSVADSAALAGAKALSHGTSAATATARDFALRNGVTPSALTIDTPYQGDSHQIKVTVTTRVPYYFTRIFGPVSQTVHASATAGFYGNPAYSGANAIAMPSSNYQSGTQYLIKLKEPANGNEGAIALGGTGASVFRDNMQYGYNGNLTLGQTVYTEPGNMTGPAQTAFRYRFDNAPANETWQNYSAGNPRAVLVVLTTPSPYNVVGRSPLQVTGFAVFFLERDAGGLVYARYIGPAATSPLGAAQSATFPSRLVQ